MAEKAVDRLRAKTGLSDYQHDMGDGRDEFGMHYLRSVGKRW